MKHVEPYILDNITFFQKRYRVHHRLSPFDLDVPAIADVVLLFIFFFIMSSSFIVQPGIKLSLPVATVNEGVPYSAMVLTVTKEGMVFFGDERISLDDVETALTQLAFEEPERTLLLQADGQVTHHELMRIYDLAIKTGVKEVALAAGLRQDQMNVVLP